MKFKKYLIPIVLLFCLALSACQQSAGGKYADYIETDTSKLEEKKLYDDESLCGHVQRFHSIPSGLNELSKNGKNDDEFIDSTGWGSESLNIVDYVKFADISKDDYIAFVNSKYKTADGEKAADADENAKLLEEALADAEAIYSGDETKISNRFNQNVQTYKPTDSEKEFSKNFFTVHGALIRYVGADKYQDYMKYVLETKYDNVKNFIEYFKIDKSTFEKIMEQAEASDFYNAGDLF